MPSMAELWPNDFYALCYNIADEHYEIRATVNSCPTFHKIVAEFDPLYRKMKAREASQKETDRFWELGEELFGPGLLKDYHQQLGEAIKKRDNEKN